MEELDRIGKNLKKLNEVQDLEKCDRQTDRQTDGVTDKVSTREACASKNKELLLTVIVI